MQPLRGKERFRNFLNMDKTERFRDFLNMDKTERFRDFLNMDKTVPPDLSRNSSHSQQVDFCNRAK